MVGMALVRKFSNVIVGDIVLPSVHYYVVKKKKKIPKKRNAKK